MENFWIQNIHYVIQVFVSFLMITAGWVYLDGWLIEKKSKTLLRASGFVILAVWALLGAMPSGFFGIGPEDSEKIMGFVGLAGFTILLLSLVIDPVPLKPNEKADTFFSQIVIKLTTNLPKKLSFIDDAFTNTAEFIDNSIKVLRRPLGIVVPLAIIIIAILTEPRIWIFFFSAIITLLLWFHYSRGIQTEWKYFYLGFLVITISLVLQTVSYLFRNTEHVLFAEIFREFGLIWSIENIIMLIGTVLLGVWAWSFIRFRIFPQIFSSFVALSFLIFVITTVLYTGFLLNRVQDNVFENLKTNIKTLEFALTNVKESAILSARIVAANPQIIEAIRLKDRAALYANLNTFMFENGNDFIIALNTGGEVIMRGEDKERYGDSIAEDPVVWRALDGKAVVTVSAEPNITIPKVSIKASSPVIDVTESGKPEIIGAIVTGYILDTAFVDGIKKITGLEAAIFAKDLSAATTFSLPGSQLRLLGAKELNETITIPVLKEGKTFSGETKILNQPFLAVYIPIKDVEETIVGMLFTGISQKDLLAIANETLKLTFSISTLLMLLSIIPLAWFAKFISYNQRI